MRHRTFGWGGAVVCGATVASALGCDRLQRSVTDQAKARAAMVDISRLEGAVVVFHLDLGAYPPDLEALRTAPKRPVGIGTWAGPYVSGRIPLDPWGSPYRYRCPGRRDGIFDIWSCGPDGIDGTHDDIENWSLTS